MPTTIVEDQIAAVYPLCGVSSTDAILYTTGDALVLGLMNEVYREVGRLCNLWRRVVEVSLTDDVAAYAYPADVRSILTEYGGVRIGTAKTPVEYIPRADLAAMYPEYRTATKTGIPTYWYEQDSRAFALYPPPLVSTTETLYLDAYITPAAGSATGQVLPLAKAASANVATATPALPADYYDVLKYGTAAKAIETYLPDDERAQALYPNAKRQYERFIGLLLERTVLG